MRKSYIKVLCLESLMIFAIIINIFLFKNFQTSNIINILIWSLANIILFFQLGFEKDKNLYKVDTIQIVIVYTFLYLLLMYSFGFITGFNRTQYSITLVNILKNIVPIIFLIILQEIFRYNVIKKCGNNKLIIYSMTVIIVCVEVMTTIGHYSLQTEIDTFETIGCLILPTIVNNIVLTFMTSKSGYYPSVIYRILNECYIYLVPIVPDLNVYLQSIISIIFPTIVFLKFNTIYAKSTFTKTRRKNMLRLTLNTSFTVVALGIILLVSGIFKYYAMAIGSNSMYPKIKKGDAVIVEKKTKTTKYFKGMTIAFHHDDEIIVHRIIKLELKNNKYYITTKGDNNNAKDNWVVIENDIVGIVKGKIPLIGLPSVWISENF